MKPPPLPSSRNFRALGIKWIVTYFAVLVLIAIALILFLDVRRAKGFEARLQSLRDQNLPVTPAELDNWYSLPSNERDGALLFRKAIQKIVDPDPGEPRLPLVTPGEILPRSERFNESTLTAMSHHVERNDAALQLLKECSQLRYFRYPVRLSDGFDAEVRHLPDIRKAVNVLLLDAVLEAETNHPRRALESVRASLMLAESLSREPVGISQLIRYSSRGLITSCLERFASQKLLSDTDLQFACDFLGATQESGGWALGMLGNRSAGLNVLQMPVSERVAFMNDPESDAKKRDNKSGLWILQLQYVLGMHHRDCHFFLDIIDDYSHAADLPFPQRLSAVQRVAERVTQLKNTENVVPWNIISLMLLPALEKAASKEAVAVAHLRTSRTALSVQRYQARFNKLPGSLSDLVPSFLDEVPTDPFSGQPLRFETNESGFMISTLPGPDPVFGVRFEVEYSTSPSFAEDFPP